MSTIVVKAKVQIMDEEDLEASQSRDLGDMTFKSSRWVYRRLGIPAEDIKRVIAFSKDKTLLEDTEGKRILVFEPFDEVYDKWKDNYEEDDLDLEVDEDQINQNGETKSEDDED